MRPLPDPNLSLRDASDFIFESELCRRALVDPDPRSLAVFLRDLLAEIQIVLPKQLSDADRQTLRQIDQHYSQNPRGELRW